MPTTLPTRPVRLLVPSALLFAALFALRLQLIADLDLTVSVALESGALRGVWYDGFVALLVSLVSMLAASVHGRSSLPGWLIGAFLVWLATVANLLHHRFFGVPLDWWIVQMHWSDVAVVQGSALQLSVGERLYLSAGLLVASMLSRILLRPAVTASSKAPAGQASAGQASAAAGAPETPAAPGRIDALSQAARSRPYWDRRRSHIRQSGVLLLLTAGWWVVPLVVSRTPEHEVGSLLTSHVLADWLKQNIKQRLYAGAGVGWAAGLGQGLTADELAAPGKVLAEYRDRGLEPGSKIVPALLEGAPPNPEPSASVSDEVAASGNAAPLLKGPPPIDPLYPLYVPLTPAPEETRALRVRLGLPPEGSIHVVYLFVESLRAFELFHPTIGPIIFPRLRKVFDTHGIVFTQAYTSAAIAGQTVRGQFSTQCSMLPNMTGAATYMAHASIRLDCIQGVLRDNGYRTTWFNSYRSSFHNKRVFETLHGMQQFFDETYFRSQGITRQIGDIGLEDRGFLRETLRKLEMLDRESNSPIYANVLTTSTHHPYSYLEDAPVPEPLFTEVNRVRPYYLNFLSRYRYADEALGDFFDALFVSPLADRTLVVLLGDHGSPVQTHLDLAPVPAAELRYRIPIALITHHLARPERIDHPVHQVDVTPTVAEIVGAKGTETWVGRSLFSPEGSQWINMNGETLRYRFGDRACYTLKVNAPLSCWDLTGIDPLYQQPARALPEDPAETAFAQKVVMANRQAIVLNQVKPHLKEE